MNNAFSINWPYIAYSGLNNELVILNAFQQDQIHRVELCQDGQKEINILGTYITDTRDLFILVHRIIQHKYEVYMLDLDACNEREQDYDDDEPVVEKICKNRGNTQNLIIRDEWDDKNKMQSTYSRLTSKKQANKKANSYDVSKPILQYT